MTKKIKQSKAYCSARGPCREGEGSEMTREGKRNRQSKGLKYIDITNIRKSSAPSNPGLYDGF